MKYKSMKKIIELQNEFKMEMKSKNKKMTLSLPNKKNFNYINITNKNNSFENLIKSSINKNKLIRNSSMKSLKKKTLLNNFISITENKNKTKNLSRNNSKIWKNIIKVKETIEGNYYKNSNNSLFKNSLIKNNLLLKKKIYVKN